MKFKISHGGRMNWLGRSGGSRLLHPPLIYRVLHFTLSRCGTWVTSAENVGIAGKPATVLCCTLTARSFQLELQLIETVPAGFWVAEPPILIELPGAADKICLFKQANFIVSVAS